MKPTPYAVCVKNDGYEASYLYPETLFVEIKLPQPVLKAFFRAA